MQQPRPLSTYIEATRPPFLLAVVMPVLLGLATSTSHSGLSSFAHYVLAMVTLVGAVSAHAGANVLNDFYDSRNGGDAANTGRIFPFTGGSRFIQEGKLTEEETGRFGWTLMAVTGGIGILLTLTSGYGLVVIGVCGLVVGWAYTAPQVFLAGMGMGELAVGIAFGSLVPAGAFYVQTGLLSWDPLLAGLPYAFLTANLLLINEFPDAVADAKVGKRTLIVRLGPETAKYVYYACAAAATFLTVFVLPFLLPGLSFFSLASLLPAAPFLLSAFAASFLHTHAANPSSLTPAIIATIAALLSHGFLLSLVIFLFSP